MCKRFGSKDLLQTLITTCFAHNIISRFFLKTEVDTREYFIAFLFYTVQFLSNKNSEMYISWNYALLDRKKGVPIANMSNFKAFSKIIIKC